MKYLQVTPLPSPIETWLHTQLEARGVDKVYSRYILSLFHSNDIDQELVDFDLPTKELKRLSRKSKHSKNVDTQKLIRASVIDCLRSVSEYEVGIESLVDELYAKLNTKELHSIVASTNQQVLQTLTNDSNTSSAPSSSDLAQKYYDAFPPLGGKNTSSSSSSLILSPAKHSSPWNGRNKKLLLTSSGCIKKLRSNKENNKKRSKLTLATELPSSGPTIIGSTIAAMERASVPFNTDSMEKKLTLSLTLDADNHEPSNANNIEKSVKRRLFVEVDEPKDSLTSLMEKVDGIKDIWSDSETQSQLSTSSASSFIPCGTNLTTSIWSDTDWDRKWTDSGVGMSLLIASPAAPAPTSSSSSSSSRTTLNHFPERSAFRLVTPIFKSLVWPVSDVVSATRPLSSRSPNENLLTSPRTHFCPIEKAPHYQSCSEEEVQYPDGTTFSVSSDNETTADYDIGEDSSLIWDSTAYMEFKPEGGLNTECLNLSFKPNLRQVDSQDHHKSAQTEDLELMSTSNNYLDTCVGAAVAATAKTVPSSSAQPSQPSTDGDEFFFPGEESIARDIMKSLDDDESFYMEEEEPCSKKSGPLLVDAWAVAWPTSSIWSHTSLATLVDDGWPTPSHDYKDIRCGQKKKQPDSDKYGLYENYSIWAPPFPLDKNSNVILCSKSETPIPLGVTMGNLKISSSDRKRRHSSSQYYGNYMFPCIKSDVSLFQQSITL